MRGLGLDGPAGTGPMAPARDTTGGDHLVGIGGYIVIEAFLDRSWVPNDIEHIDDPA